MPNKKKYRIWCNTEASNVSGYSNLDDPPSTCPNNAAHSVNADTKCVTEVYCVDNLTATADPGVGDDIDDGYGVGSRWVNTQTANEFSCADNTKDAAVWIKSRKDVFGTEYHYAESLSESSTTSTNYQEKVELVIANLSAGTYRVGWSSGMRSSSGAKSYAARCLLDDTTDLGYVQNYNPEYMVFAGFASVTLTSGSHVVCLEYKAVQESMTVYMRNARIEIWRVS